jgi:membrane protease YdiL (CAAX protease family)
MAILGINLFVSSLPFSESISNIDEINKLKTEMGAVGFFIIVVIFTPLFETIIFQATVISIVSWILKKINFYTPIIPVIFSSVAFAFAHSYHLTYIIAGFFVGFILALLYIIVKFKQASPVFVVSAVHSTINLVPFFKDFVF